MTGYPNRKRTTLSGHAAGAPRVASGGQCPELRNWNSANAFTTPFGGVIELVAIWGGSTRTTEKRRQRWASDQDDVRALPTLSVRMEWTEVYARRRAYMRRGDDLGLPRFPDKNFRPKWQNRGSHRLVQTNPQHRRGTCPNKKRSIASGSTSPLQVGVTGTRLQVPVNALLFRSEGLPTLWSSTLSQDAVAAIAIRGRDTARRWKCFKSAPG